MTAIRPALAALFTLILPLLSGCGGGGDDTSPPPVAQQGKLRPVSSADELEESIKSGLTNLQNMDATTTAQTPQADGFTTTYTQEANIDEYDSVRYDGEHLYVAPTRFFSCCFLLQPAAEPVQQDEPERAIRIVATDADAATAQETARVELADDVSVQGLFVQDDRLVALTSTAYYGSYGPWFEDLAVWAPERTGVLIYDVADRSAPVLDVELTIDGVMIDSRRIGSTVYLITRHTPNVNGLIYYVTNPSQQAQNEALLADVSLDELLPSLTVNGAARTLFDPTDCYVANGDDGGYGAITSVTAIDLDSPQTPTTFCYNEPSQGVYLTQQSLYFTRTEASIDGAMTTIHKFSNDGNASAYRGSADIDGSVWRGGQADFRMSEHDGDLRVMAVLFEDSSQDRLDHKLYVLRESTTTAQLQIVGELPNEQRPAEIGRPNEALYGVRFLDDRAYAVTFEQIDPLYVLDLSDPTDPSIAGELTVTGFSDFLHPVSDDLLLGVGTAQNGGVKVELFDVSVTSQPLSRGAVEMGTSTYSEAVYDRRAFAYLPGENTDRFTLPFQRYLTGDFEHGLALFEIRDKTLPNLSELVQVGVLSPPADEPLRSPLRQRGYLNADAVFYVEDQSIWGAFWQTPSEVNGPF